MERFALRDDQWERTRAHGRAHPESDITSAHGISQIILDPQESRQRAPSADIVELDPPSMSHFDEP